MSGVITVGRFMDDFGYYVYPYQLENYMARYWFYKDNWYD